MILLKIHLGKIFTGQSDIVKLDSRVLENQSRDLGASSSREVGQSYFFAVASFHLQHLKVILVKMIIKNYNSKRLNGEKKCSGFSHNFHLQALAETLSQFLDHFLLGASFSHFSPN